jgi:hypothetical protein
MARAYGFDFVFFMITIDVNIRWGKHGPTRGPTMGRGVSTNNRVAREKLAAPLDQSESI